MTLLNPEPDLTDNPEYSGVLYYWIWQFKLNRVSLFDITGLVDFGRTLYISSTKELLVMMYTYGLLLLVI